MTETGIQLASSQTLETDIIVIATGLKLKLVGGARISMDNVPISVGEKLLWKATILQDVLNMAFVAGYTNASWTLGADATALLVCRLLKSMNIKELTSALPRLGLDNGKDMSFVPILNLSSTYIVRGAKELPRTVDKTPWLPRSNYFADL